LKYRFSIVPKRKPLLAAGAKSASSLQELMETCDVVLTMLSNDAAVKEVLRDQKVYFVCSICWKNNHQYEYGCTGNLALFKHHLQPTSVHFIDAPVSGSVKPAQDGTLVICRCFK
jgi:3-hydroxyisobutyrate dehydrogenase